jgi:heptaprenyl diphosphate synthase
VGQLRESVGPKSGEDAVQHHLEVLADKTGSLIAAAGRYGAMMSGVDAQTTDAIAEFGECIGVVFQLSDDLLDIESEVSGKTPGTDLREGIKTLPALLALQDATTTEELRDLLSRPLPNDDDHTRALNLLRAHPAMNAARNVLIEWADRARALLEELPDRPARLALNVLIDSVTDRKI